MIAPTASSSDGSPDLHAWTKSNVKGKRPPGQSPAAIRCAPSAARWMGRSDPSVAPACPAHAREARSVVATIAPTHCQARDLQKTFGHLFDENKFESVNRSIKPRRHDHSRPNCVRVIATSIESVPGISHKLVPVIRARTIQNHTMPEAIAVRPLHTASNRNCLRRASMWCKALRSTWLSAGVAIKISNANKDRRIRHAPMCTARVITINMFRAVSSLAVRSKGQSEM